VWRARISEQEQDLGVDAAVRGGHIREVPVVASRQVVDQLGDRSDVWFS
jgi:hypothetical protein